MSKYFILVPIIYLVTKYTLYNFNIKMLFKGKPKKNIFKKNKIVNYFKNYNNQNITVDNLTIRTEGEYLDCLYIKNKSKYLTIYFHGTRGNLYDCLHKNDIKNILNYSNLFIYDYRGYGNSTGYTNENNIRNDSLLIYMYALTSLNYNPNNIIIYGNSLGSYIGCNLINLLVNLKLTIPKGLIMQSPFYSLYEICSDLYPLLKYSLQFNLCNSTILKNIKDKLHIILLHSDNDGYININHSIKLYNENKNFINLIKISGIHDMIFYDNTINNQIKAILKI